ncbi:pyridoxal phosphate-dependent transferase [Ephemerocybe angulata]|uniref:Pyridoxal phosphate-dependent transferase n=1 Tax=Ephemerocybe angulata TaxID=980116 RepID=A0A8H6LZL3_9AGAR|nr:pyridoxal phosphate-dependent transferase [Tulosesus angulatus]
MGRTGDYWRAGSSEGPGNLLGTASRSGVITRGEIARKMKKGTMRGTAYAGNAVSCAAAVEVANWFKEDGVLENVRAWEKELFAALEKLKADAEVGKWIDVRGKGLMVGVEFTQGMGATAAGATGEKAPKDLAKRVAQRCVDKGMLILTTSMFEVIWFIPPLNVSKVDLKKEEAVREVVKEGDR